MNPGTAMFRLLRILIVYAVLASGLAGCSTTEFCGKEIGAENREPVLVTIHGDVKEPGPRYIKRAFTKESVQQAGGGWWVESFGGLTPVSFKLTRRSGQHNKSWVVFFAEMNASKWKRFQFQEGDDIFVYSAIF